jgi:hypothetical protein
MALKCLKIKFGIEILQNLRIKKFLAKINKHKIDLRGVKFFLINFAAILAKSWRFVSNSRFFYHTASVLRLSYGP